MEKAALSVSKFALTEVLGYAKSLIAQEVALQLGVQRDQAFIRDELEMMLAFLMAAHEERDGHMVIKTWVKQVRDTAYDVEDSLLDFAVRLKKPSWWRIIRMLKMLIQKHHVAKQMKELRAKVEDVSQRNVRYQLMEGSKTTIALDASQLSNASFDMGETRQLTDNADTEVHLSVLISREEEDKKNLQVIPLWGTTGVRGQTSIIKWAYDDLKNENKFDCCAWIRITHPFDVPEFLRCILSQFYISDLEKTGKTLEHTPLGAQVFKKMEMMKQMDLLLDEFSRYVNEKKYLVVLSDISTIEEWDWIMTYFPKINQKGSRIVVSTEHIEVARLCAGRRVKMLELKESHPDQRIYAFYGTGLLDDRKDSAVAGSSNNSSDGETPKASSCPKLELTGVKEKREQIIHLISKKSVEGRPQVISVWGTGGIGKTVLAKDVYLQNQKRFEKSAFVTVKHPCDREYLINSIIMQLSSEKKKVGIEEKVAARGMIKLKEVKKSQKSNFDNLLQGEYLIVLDDISSIAEWEAVKTDLKGDTGQIIVTTRDKRVAKCCSPMEENQVHVTELNNKDAHALFTTKVFGKETDLDKEYPDLVKVADLILKWCGGLPLAIVTIACYLADKPKTHVVWRKLTSHIRAELDTNPELEPVKNVLNSCYDGLSYHLKSCFLYLSIFPEDHTISRRRLVRRWIAEGFSSEMHHGKSMEEIASRYFDELIEKSMIKPANYSIRSRKEIDSCQVHDLMHEISTLRSMEENLVFRLEEGGLKTRGRTRHLSVSSNWKGDQSEFNLVESSRIRSLTVFGKWRPFFISENMRSLRVLDLEGTSGLVQHHLDDIGKLVVLKYLSLRGCRGIIYLPDSFGNLRQLQTLDISGTSIMYLPKTIKKLTELQYLRAWTKRLPEGEREDDLSLFYIAESCAACCAPQIMERLLEPSETSESSNNYLRSDVCSFCCCLMFPTLKRRLKVPGVVVPKGVRRLKALHTLGGVNIERGTAILHDIRRLAGGLRKLSVTGINKDNCEQLCSALARLSNLESLLVRSDGARSLTGFLLTSLPESLQSLKLIGTVDKFLEQVKQLNNLERLKNLEKLKLKSTKLELDETTIKDLGDLPKLKILRLLRDSFQGDLLVLEFPEKAFKNLKVLELDTIGNLASVKFLHKGATQAQNAPDGQSSKVEHENTATPKLELLQYRDRGDGEVNPTLFSGLEFLPSLTKILLPNNDKYKQDFMDTVQKQLDKSIKESNKPVLEYM